MSDQPVVILAEDHEASRKAMQGLLKNAGYSVIPCEDAQTALTRIREMGDHPPAALITDYDMPGMDARELTHIVRSEAGLPNGLQIIIVTAHYDKGAALVDEGLADASVKKPINFAEFIVDLNKRTGHANGNGHHKQQVENNKNNQFRTPGGN